MLWGDLNGLRQRKCWSSSKYAAIQAAHSIFPLGLNKSLHRITGTCSKTDSDTVRSIREGEAGQPNFRSQEYS